MKNINWTAVAAWLGTAAAVIVALLLTKNAMCLWAFAFPAGLELVDKGTQRGKEE